MAMTLHKAQFPRLSNAQQKVATDGAPTSGAAVATSADSLSAFHDTTPAASGADTAIDAFVEGRHFTR